MDSERRYILPKNPEKAAMVCAKSVPNLCQFAQILAFAKLTEAARSRAKIDASC
jgi:hypothetical protein